MKGKPAHVVHMVIRIRVARGVHGRFVNAHVFYTTPRNAPPTVFTLLCYSSHSFTSNLHLLIPIDFAIEDLLLRVYDKYTRLENDLLWKEKKRKWIELRISNGIAKSRNILKNLHLFRENQWCIYIRYFKYVKNADTWKEEQFEQRR